MESEAAYERGGYLLKRTGMLLWKKRYFVLKSAATEVEKMRSFFLRNVVETSDNALYRSVNKPLFETIASAAVSGNGLLFYYEDEASTEPLCIVDLVATRGFGSLKLSTRPYPFVIKAAGKKDLVLSASTDAERDEWLRPLIFLRRRAQEQDSNKDSPLYAETMELLNTRQLFTNSPFPMPSMPVIEMESSSALETSTLEASPPAEHSSDEHTSVVAQTGHAEAETVASGAIEEVATIEKGLELPISEVAPLSAAEPAVPETRPLSFLQSIWSTLFGNGVSDDTKYPLPPETRLSGWLLKQSDFWKVWNKRFMVLHETDGQLYLSYYRPSNKPVDKQAGCLLLDGTQIVSTYLTPRPFSFTVKAQGKSFILNAESAQTRDIWVNLIKPE